MVGPDDSWQVSAVQHAGPHPEPDCRGLARSFHLKRPILISSETGRFAEVIGSQQPLVRLHPKVARPAIVEDAIMKFSRVVAFVAAVLIAVIITFSLQRQHVGAQEAQSIEASAAP
jgi:hypothetical protein